MEEERRLMYVAITRAKDVLFISHAESRQQRWQTKYNLPSQFIDELPVELIKTFDLSGSETAKSSKIISFDEWDIVRHKLFGKGTVVEIWNDVAIVKFWNAKYGHRKIDIRFLDIDS